MDIPAPVPRRVLMTADAVGGIWHYAVGLAAALARWDIEVVVARMGPPRTAAAHRDDQLPGNVVLAEADFPLEWMIWEDDRAEAAGAWLQDLAARWSPEVIHLNHYAPAALDWAAPTVLVAHSCVQSWWRACRGEPTPAEWRPYAERVARGVHSADVLVWRPRD